MDTFQGVTALIRQKKKNQFMHFNSSSQRGRFCLNFIIGMKQVRKKGKNYILLYFVMEDWNNN